MTKTDFLSLVGHNLSLLSWCKPDLQSIDSGHGVTFEENTSVLGLYLVFKEQKGNRLPDQHGRTGLEVCWVILPSLGWIFLNGPREGSINYSAICWEHKEQRVGFGDYPLDPKELKYMGYLSPEQCKWTFEVTYPPNQSIHWPGSDWKYNPGIRWMVQNGTQWLCGPNLWLWLPIGWVSHCTLGFTLAHGSVKPNLQQGPVNLPYLHARWTRSVFQWYEYIAALFIPSIGTTDIMIKVEALTNFTTGPPK